MSWIVSLERLLIWLVLLAALLTGCANPLARSAGGRSTATSEEDDEGIALDGNLGENLMNRVTGRGAAASVPYAKNLPWIGTPNQDEATARKHFAAGEQAFQRRDFSGAIDYFQKAALHFPDSPLHEDAMFRIGECHFLADEYTTAFKTYEQLIAKYKRTRHLDTVAARQFAIGQYWLRRHSEDPRFFLSPNFTDKTQPRLDTLGRALRAFEKVRLNNPTGPLADDSVMASAGVHFARAQYYDADYFYTLLRREYPDSEHQYEAHILGIQAKMLSYQGPDYEGTPLEEALELADQSLKQFPNRSSEDRQRIVDARRRIVTGLAQREYEKAEYFVNQGYHGAAQIYYERVVNDYPETQYATLAQQQIPEVAVKPAKPPERLSWISAVFPEQKDKNELELTGVPAQVATQPSNAPRR